MILKTNGSLSWFEFSLLSGREDIKHAVYTRKGGVSVEPFDSLNLGLSTKDSKESVLQNREVIKKHLNISKLVIPNQKHTIHIEHYPFLTESIDLGCDAVITNEKEIGLFIQHADCQAAIFFDPVQKCLANVHCGWRGNVGNIYAKVIEKLHQVFGSQPKNLLVCISPSLGPNFSEFINLKKEFPNSFWKYATEQNYLNLWQISQDQLLATGVQEKSIEIASLCTYQNEEHFYSYRRSKETGRNATVAVLT